MTTTAKKPRTPKPHALAFIADEPCPNCGCEWFRPTINFTDNLDIDGPAPDSACANLWCPAIRQLRALIDKLKADRLALAKLAAETPQFDNPLKAWGAQALRDRVLAAAEKPHV